VSLKNVKSTLSQWAWGFEESQTLSPMTSDDPRDHAGKLSKERIARSKLNLLPLVEQGTALRVYGQDRPLPNHYSYTIYHVNYMYVHVSDATKSNRRPDDSMRQSV